MLKLASGSAFAVTAVSLLLGASAALPFGSGAAHAAQARTQFVHIRNFAFVPAVVTVTAGTTVTWTNADDDPHSVVAVAKAFRSPALDTDGRFSFTFIKAGDYAYFCSLHPHMVGKIIVKAS